MLRILAVMSMERSGVIFRADPVTKLAARGAPEVAILGWDVPGGELLIVIVAGCLVVTTKDDRESEGVSTNDAPGLGLKACEFVDDEGVAEKG